jgi:sigma-E factor negative regulatory protein RseB
MKFWFLIFIGVSAGAGAADTGPAQDAAGWLKKIAGASRQVSYSGTFVYQHGGQVETSRIVHFVNAAGGEIERLEALDGPAREIIRNNDQVVCYWPKSKTLVVEERGRRQFPALLVERLAEIAENYEVRKENTDRVAGHDCTWIALAPRDNLRYGKRFCAETRSGLPLRAQTLNERKEMVESFAFTQIAFGGSFNRDAVKSKYAAISRAQNWRVERSAFSVPAAGEVVAESGWSLSAKVPGFQKVMETRRSLPGRSESVSHLVFSDGLAAISVFIEPATKSASPPPQSLTRQGAVNIFARQSAGYIITALGEAPAGTVMQLSNSLERKAPHPR